MREPLHPPWVLLRMLQRVAQRRAPTPSVAAEEAVAALYPSRLGSQRQMARAYSINGPAT